MRVLYFGTYDRAYPRNAQVISALRGAGVEVREQHRAVWERRHNWSVGLRQMLRVAEAEHSLRKSRDDERDADALIVGYPGHFDLPAAKRVARGRPVIFNPLVSLFDTIVDDRQRFRRGSPGAGVVHIVDRRAFRRADRVVADTDAHAEFFRDEFGLAAGPGRGVLRRSGGQALPARLAAGGPVSRALRRQADPAARSRDDPRRRRARAGDPVPRRRQRPARASPRRPARERRLGSLGRLRRPAERDPGGRVCARHLRHDAPRLRG